MKTFTPFNYQDRQWDARFNLPTQEDVDTLVAAAQSLFDAGRLRYLLIGGVEIGANPKQDDYNIRHCHVALYFHNPTAKSAILKHLAVKQGYGYYLVSRNRNLPFSGWRKHHTKVETKVDGNQLVLLELGVLPEDDNRQFVLRSNEEKKRKVDEVLIEIRDMLKQQKTEDEIFQRFPRNWVQYGEKLKSMTVQRADFFKSNGDPHIWLHGTPGCGKSSLIAWIYPKLYKKNLYNRFWDLYNPNVHTHTLLEDLDHQAVETLKLNFIKTICDESGFTYDQKYKTAQPARTTVLVTSQFTIQCILQNVLVENSSQQAAIRRRFWEVSAIELQRILKVKLRNTYELRQLKKEGNEDPSKCFISWNYPEDMPSLRPLPTVEEAQAMIREAYYKA